MWQLLIPLLGNVFDKIFPDKTKADEAKARLIESVIESEDPQKCYAFGALVSSGKQIEAEARDTSSIATTCSR